MSSPRNVKLVLAAVFSLITLLALPRSTFAQHPDVIRGRVIATDSTPLENAIVAVRDSGAAPTTPPRQVRTDSKGAYSLTITDGSGIYMVAAQMLGHAPQRRFVHRPAGDGPIPPVNFSLAPAAATLGAVRSVGERPKTTRSDMQADQSIGGQTQFTSLSNGLTGDMTGDLTSALAGVAGITFIPDPSGGLPSVSAFGVGGDQNGTVLNGLGFGGSVPRDGTRAGLVVSSYDPSRGFFGGVQQSLRLSQGSNMIYRSNHTTLDAPSLQYTTPTAQRLGTQYSQVVTSGTVSGPMILDKLFYSTNYQLSRRNQDLTSLTSLGPSSFDAMKLSSDSVTRLLSAVLPPSGIPATLGDVPGGRQREELRLTERIDFTPSPVPNNFPPGVIIFGGPGQTVDAYYLQFGGTFNRNDGNGIFATTAPAAGNKQSHRDGWAQFTAAKYLPLNILNETTLGFSGREDQGTPYLDLPNARVSIESGQSDGTIAITPVSVGGTNSPANDQRGWATQVRNETSWNTWDRKHSFKLTLDGTQDGYWYHQDAGYGTYTFNSLSDFANNIPATYSRTLTARQSSGQGFTGAIGLGDVWNMNATNQAAAQAANQTPPIRPTFQYGVRLEGNHFDVRPAYNPAVDSIFGLRTDHVPNTLALTPMLGFTVPVLPVMQVQGFNIGRRGTISGGIREYRGTIATRAIDNYSRQTGLPDAVQTLYCVGAAAPAPDWPLWSQSPDSVPTACAGGAGGSPLSQTAPNVAVYSPNYTLFQSWRPALQFRYTVNNYASVTLTGNYALNRHMPGTVDVNFNDQRQDSLTAENNRPVYVPASSIVPATGAVAWTQSRVSQAFARVGETVSDLEGRNTSVGGSVNFGSCSVFCIGGFNTVFWNASVSYSYNDSRQQFHGFSSTAGDPTQTFWAAGSQARHTIVLNGNVNRNNLGSITLFARIQSGLLYTPGVAGDINGDGNFNDRAFIFDPTSPKTDSTLAAGMAQLLGTAPGGARDCLKRQLGAIAGYNSCTGPWTFNYLSMQIRPDPYKLGFKNRGSISLFFTNILAGLDQAFHGSNNLRGWGQNAFPSSNLLTVRGFNTSTNNFIYTVNPLFGNVSTSQAVSRQPFMVTLDVTLNVEPDRESQYLTTSLRRPPPVGAMPVADTSREMAWQQIKTKITSPQNPLDRLILSAKDSLKLDSAQVQRLQVMEQRIGRIRDSVSTDMAKYLYSRHGNYYGEEVREKWHSAGVTTYSAFFQALQEFVAILTPEQKEHSTHVPQLQGIVLQASMLKASDLPTMFRGPMNQLP